MKYTRIKPKYIAALALLGLGFGHAYANGGYGTDSVREGDSLTGGHALAGARSEVDARRADQARALQAMNETLKESLVVEALGDFSRVELCSNPRYAGRGIYCASAEDLMVGFPSHRDAIADAVIKEAQRFAKENESRVYSNRFGVVELRPDFLELLSKEHRLMGCYGHDLSNTAILLGAQRADGDGHTRTLLRNECTPTLQEEGVTAAMIGLRRKAVVSQVRSLSALLLEIRDSGYSSVAKINMAVAVVSSVVVLTKSIAYELRAEVGDDNDDDVTCARIDLAEFYRRLKAGWASQFDVDLDEVEGITVQPGTANLGATYALNHAGADEWAEEGGVNNRDGSVDGTRYGTDTSGRVGSLGMGVGSEGESGPVDLSDLVGQLDASLRASGFFEPGPGMGALNRMGQQQLGWHSAWDFEKPGNCVDFVVTTSVLMGSLALAVVGTPGAAVVTLIAAASWTYNFIDTLSEEEDTRDGSTMDYHRSPPAVAVRSQLKELEELLSNRVLRDPTYSDGSDRTMIELRSGGGVDARRKDFAFLSALRAVARFLLVDEEELGQLRRTR